MIYCYEYVYSNIFLLHLLIHYKSYATFTNIGYENASIVILVKNDLLIFNCFRNIYGCFLMICSTCFKQVAFAKKYRMKGVNMCSSYRYNVDIATEKLENGNLMILDKQTKKVHVINNTALIVYQMCIDHDVHQIAEEIKKNFTDAPDIESIQQDVENIITNFLNDKLICRE